MQLTPTLFNSSSSSSMENIAGTPFSSPNGIYASQPVPWQAPETNHPPLTKKKFKILNALERKGISQRQKELEERMQIGYTPSLEISLLKARLKELESCFQVVKDQSREDKASLRQTQEQLQHKDSRIQSLEAELRILQTQKKEQELQHEEIKKEVESKKRKFSEYEKQQEEDKQAIQKLKKNYDVCSDSLADLAIKHHKLRREHEGELALSKQKISTLEQDLKKEQALHEDVQTQLTSVEKTLQLKTTELTQMTRLKNTKEFLLEEEKKTVEKLNLDIQNLIRTVEQLQQELNEKGNEITLLKKTLEEQKKCLLQINSAMDQVKTIIDFS